MADKIINNQNLMKKHERYIIHWLAFTFFAFSAFGALWQHAHPVITIVILLSVIPAMLVVLIPDRFMPEMLRCFMQFIIAMVAICWGGYRLYTQTPVDRMLIESMCILGFCLAFASSYKSYSYLFTVSLIAIIYGSVFPRDVFIYSLPFAIFCCFAFLYYTRPVALAHDSCIRLPISVFYRNAGYMTVHVIITLLLTVYLYSIFPTPAKIHLGYIMSSIRSDSDTYMPPEYHRWFNSEYVKEGDNTNLTTKSGYKPTVIAKSGIKVQGQKNGMEMGNGGGAGTPGDDLVFRVKSPVKLYWLAKLYDVYDGKKWIASKKMRKQRVMLSDQDWDCIKLVRQKFVVEKWISPVLASAFMGRFYSLPGFFLKTKGTFYNKSFKKGNEYPKAPYKYSVGSVMTCSFKAKKDTKLSQKNKKKKRKNRPSFWYERLPEKHYLQLPKTISNRVKQLAVGLTGHVHSPYEKAVLLRDYLRNNFTYKQFSAKVPDGREAVDSFLFGQEKAGHCEFFAAALTVLARVNGLPARVATGFSPGNYNVLNGFFEVYEYHAHAWTQIFIEGKGWLTFDATPPGEIISKNYPLGLGQLNDPFGDEWRVMPPELTPSTVKYLKEPVFRVTQESQFGSEIVNKILAQIARIDESSPTPKKMTAAKQVKKKPVAKKGAQKKKIKSRKQAVVKKAVPQKDDRTKESIWEIVKKWFNALKVNFIAMMKQALSSVRQAINWLYSYDGLVFIALVFAGFICYHILKRLKGFLVKKYTLKRCRHDYEEACHIVRNNPEKSIVLCYHLVRTLLDLSGFPRERNLDLFDYGSSLKRINGKFCKDVLVIFFLFSQTEYSPDEPTVEDSGKMLEYTTTVKNFLLDNIL